MRQCSGMSPERDYDSCVTIMSGMRNCVAVGVAGLCVFSSTAFASRDGNKVVVLGSKSFYGVPPNNAIGWGTAHPKIIFNGGDPSGRVWEISWKHWGAAATLGYGLTWIPTPNGGYYGTPVHIELRASSFGRCTPSGPVAYRKLEVRGPSRPGGRLGSWGNWSFTGTICHS